MEGVCVAVPPDKDACRVDQTLPKAADVDWNRRVKLANEAKMVLMRMADENGIWPQGGDIKLPAFL